MMKIETMDKADINLVQIKNGTPHCIKHGAMNKVSPDGKWRCIGNYKYPDGKQGKFIDNTCLAGCQEVRER